MHKDIIQKTEAVRINRFLSQAGVCSRREADALIAAGRVTVNGRKAENGMRADGNSLVCVDGIQVIQEPEKIVLAVNKPVGVVCTTDTTWGDRLLGDLIDSDKRVFYVGRLDKESRGLILMTNQGDLADRMMRAGNYHEKEYRVSVDHDITAEFLKKMKEGVWLEDLHTTTRKCKVQILDRKSFSIVLTQGLNRQIRRMCSACGYKVLDLQRVRVMNIRLDGLRPGEYRKLTSEEIEELDRSSRRGRE